MLGNVKSGPIRNNGGTALMGGTVSAHSTTKSLDGTYLGYRSGSNGSNIQVGSALAKAISGGTLAKMESGKYIGMIYPNSKIAGISSSLLAGGAGYSGRRSENSFIGSVMTQRYITTGGWDYETGAAVNRTDNRDTISGGTPPSLLVPGKLTYMVTGTTATVDNYKPKTD